MKNRGSKTYAYFSPLDGLALGLLCIDSPEPIERNPFNWVRLSSICSIEFDLFGFSNVRNTMPGVLGLNHHDENLEQNVCFN